MKNTIKKPLFTFFLLLIGVFHSSGQSICLNFGDILTTQPQVQLGNDCPFKLSNIPVYVVGTGYGTECTQHIFCSPIGSQVSSSCDKIYRIAIRSDSFPYHENIDSLKFKLSYNDGNVITGRFQNRNVESSENKGLNSRNEFTIKNFQATDIIFIDESQYGLLQSHSGQNRYNSVLITPYYKASNPCNDPDVEIIEKMLANLSERKRRDFHEYWDSTVVYDPASIPRVVRDGSVEGVWAFIKTKQSYQAPLYNDFPGFAGSLPFFTTYFTRSGCLPDINNPFVPIQGALLAYETSVTLLASPLTGPIQNCDKVFLAPTPARLGAGLLVNLLTVQIGTKSLSILPHDCDANFYTEPVRLVVDEKQHKITNYTLKGHFLYPGKVERTVVGGCDDKITVVTHGIGFTTCGSTWTGMAVANINKCTGKTTFHRVSKRLHDEFNYGK